MVAAESAYKSQTLKHLGLQYYCIRYCIEYCIECCIENCIEYCIEYFAARGTAFVGMAVAEPMLRSS